MCQYQHMKSQLELKFYEMKKKEKGPEKNYDL